MIENKWQKQSKISKASQVAFELEQELVENIRQLSVQDGLTPSDQIRKIIELPYSIPKRPRLTISLTSDDYEKLACKYKIISSNTLEIKKKIIENLVSYFKNS